MSRPDADRRAILLAVSAGGALGAGARHEVGVWWPTPAGAFPSTTLAVNVVGCLLIGVLAVLVTSAWPHRRLLRPFWGTGVLGGFTTFSAYAVDVHALVRAGRPAVAAAYLVLTPVCAVLAAAVAARATRCLVDRRVT